MSKASSDFPVARSGRRVTKNFDAGTGCRDYYSRMNRLKPNRVALLLLAVWLPLAPIAAVPTIAMTSEMSMASDTGTDGCDPCPDMDMDRATCVLKCLGATYFALIPDPVRLSATSERECYLERVPYLSGRSATPEPGPPRIRLS